MNLYVSISCGERAVLARPIIAISDQRLIGEMLLPLTKILSNERSGQSPNEPGRLLQLIAHPAPTSALRFGDAVGFAARP